MARKNSVCAIMGSPLFHLRACRGPSLHFLACMMFCALALQCCSCVTEARPTHLHSRPPRPPLPPSLPSPTAPPPPPPPSTPNCTQLQGLSQGPYWIEENIEASNVRVNVSYGVPLNITFKVANGTLSDLAGGCVGIEAARVDLWHCRYDGIYSDEAKEGTVGETWLRGYQYTNSSGYASFYTIYPGWYKSRTVHIHARVRLYDDDGNTSLYSNTTQLYFDDTISEAIFTNVYPYTLKGSRDTYNANDSLFRSSNLIALTGSYSGSDGYSGIVELNLPFSHFHSALEDGKSIRSGHGSSTGLVSIS